MVYETGYDYYTHNIIHSFMGKLKVDGYFHPDSPDRYHGWIKVLGKKRELYDCTITDGRYQYKLDAIGLHIAIDAVVGDDDWSITGIATAAGHDPMPVEGGTVKRIRLSDGSEESLDRWRS